MYTVPRNTQEYTQEFRNYTGITGIGIQESGPPGTQNLYSSQFSEAHCTLLPVDKSLFTTSDRSFCPSSSMSGISSMEGGLIW